LHLLDVCLQPGAWVGQLVLSSGVAATHISLSMNSNRPFTVLSASGLSCFSNTGPTSL
jgi:hypothetical protein